MALVNRLYPKLCYFLSNLLSTHSCLGRVRRSFDLVAGPSPCSIKRACHLEMILSAVDAIGLTPLRTNHM